MSDMKTFTVRELDRETARVMEACDADGAVQIKRRNGRLYTMRPDQSPKGKFDWTGWWAERRKWIKKTCPVPLTKKEARELDRMIAGE